MAFTPQQSVDEAQAVYLNEGTVVYTDTKLFSVFQAQWKLLWSKLYQARYSFTRDDLVVTGTGPVVNRSNIAVPCRRVVAVFERSGSSADPDQDTSNPWIPMRRVQFLPNWPASNRLKVWMPFAPGIIQVLPVTEARTVLARRAVSTPAVASLATSLSYDELMPYMSAKIAAVAALTIGQNPTRAAACNAVAEDELATLLSFETTTQQNVQLKRRDYRGYKGRRRIMR